MTNPSKILVIAKRNLLYIETMNHKLTPLFEMTDKKILSKANNQVSDVLPNRMMIEKKV